MMFIREQMGRFAELQYFVAMEDEHLDRYIWSPTSCRHTNWTFKPKRGRVDWYATQEQIL